MKTHLLLPSLFSLVLLILMPSCAGGPVYEDVKAAGSLRPPPGKGMVLVYWEGGFAGAAARINVHANDQLLIKGMRRGAFYSYAAGPGPVKFSTSNRNAGNIVTGLVIGTVIAGPVGTAVMGGAAAMGAREKERLVLHVVPGATYFVDMHYGKMRVQTQEDGEEAISECRWINAPGS